MASVHSIELGGFKAYSEPRRIDVEPITLILGANSAGKSTLLQGLLVLAQSIPGPGIPPWRLATTGRFVDHGRFDNVVHAGLQGDARQVLLGVNHGAHKGMTAVFGGEGDLMELRLHDQHSVWPFRVHRGESLTLVPDRAGFTELRGSDDESRSVLSLLATGRVRAEIHISNGRAEVELTRQDDLDPESLRLLQLHARGSRGLQETVGSMLLARVTRSLGAFTDCLWSVFPVGPGRVYGLRTERIDEGGVERWVGMAGERILQVLADHPDIRSRLDRWAELLEIPYRFDWVEAGHSGRTIELLLESTHGIPHRVGLPDVGFGIGQVLPLLVQLAVVDEGLVTVEQPEIHLHPRLQALLARLLVDWARPRDGEEWGRRKVVVETHSEHLVLGLQALVGSRNGLPPEKVSLLVVHRSAADGDLEHIPVVSRIRLDESGEMCDAWPGGFFPERAHLMTLGRVDP